VAGGGPDLARGVAGDVPDSDGASSGGVSEQRHGVQSRSHTAGRTRSRTRHAHGKHWWTSRFCVFTHGSDLGDCFDLPAGGGEQPPDSSETTMLIGPAP
jgi:hypothetical protein